MLTMMIGLNRGEIMGLNKNTLYLSDLHKVIQNFKILDKLAGKVICITGATGLIGSTIVDMLLALNKVKKLNLSIIVCSRNLEKLKARFGESDKALKFIEYNALYPLTFQENIDYIIHAASNASPDLYIDEPVETMNTNYLGLLNLLKYGKKYKTQRILYISSSEVYGENSKNEPLSENDYGKIDILNPRSSYSSSKRAAETLGISYMKEFGVDFEIVRPGHIYGPSSTQNDKRVSSLFMNMGVLGENIVMKSSGNQIRSYTYSVDCAAAILYVLIAGEKGEAYNISNRNSIISIKEMAELVAQFAGVKLLFDIPDLEERKKFNPMINSSLDSKKIESLGWHGLFDASEGIKHTIQILEDEGDK